jgi:Flp pilus assembly protein TadB
MYNGVGIDFVYFGSIFLVAFFVRSSEMSRSRTKSNRSRIEVESSTPARADERSERSERSERRRMSTDRLKKAKASDSAPSLSMSVYCFFEASQKLT